MKPEIGEKYEAAVDELIKSRMRFLDRQLGQIKKGGGNRNAYLALLIKAISTAMVVDKDQKPSFSPDAPPTSNTWTSEQKKLWKEFVGPYLAFCHKDSKTGERDSLQCLNLLARTFEIIARYLACDYLANHDQTW